MTKTKSTKRALLLSALSLLLCVSMLVGSTFAWFTDSVTSGNNIIKSGNLDVELEYKAVKDGNFTADWATVKDQDNIFDKNALWEPGRVEVVYLKVSNLGSLALKYQLGVNVISETLGKNEDGEDIRLSEHLVFKVVDLTTEPTAPYTREEAIKKTADTDLGLKDYNGTTTALEVGGEDYVALIVYMPESVGNEANYRGTDVPTIELGINLFATQYTVEEDAFDELYDKNAWVDGMKVYDAQDLQAAINAGEANITLMANINASEAIVIPEGKTIALNLNGYTVSAASGNALKNNGTLTLTGGTVSATAAYAIVNSGTLTIDNATVDGGISNAGAITVESGKVQTTRGGSSHAIYHTGTALTINGGEFSGNGNEIISDQSSTKSTIVINGGTFDKVEKASYLIRDTKGTLVINGGTFYAYDENGVNPATHQVYGATIYGGTFNYDPTDKGVASGYKAVENNGKYVVVADNIDSVITSAADLLALSGKYVVSNNGVAEEITYSLIADIDLGGAEFKEIGVAYGDTLNFLGNGHTISNMKLSTGNHNGMTNVGMFYVDSSATLNVSGVKLVNPVVEDGVDTYTIGAAAVVGYANGVVNLNNVDVTGAKINNSKGNAAVYVGYCVNNVTLTDCDIADAVVTGELENGAVRADKTGAFAGTVNTASCMLSLNNCTNSTALPQAGRVIGGATVYVDGALQKTAASQDDLNSAVASGGKVAVSLSSGSYTMPGTNGDVTISGTKDTVIDLGKTSANNATFNGVTVKSTGYYGGLIDNDTIVFNDCTIDGKIYLYGEKVVFNNCTFDLEDTDDYIWVYATKNAEFNNCTFNTMGKAILIFQDGSTVNQTVKVENCTFNASTSAHNWDGSIHISAVSMDGSRGGTYNVILNNNTVDEDFNGLWQDKSSAGNITVTVDGTTVLTPNT